jgi:hypothetical protein
MRLSRGDGVGGEQLQLDAHGKRRTAWLLIAATGGAYIGIMLGMPVEQEIWAQHFAGDFGANARMQALLQSGSGAIGFAINPLIAALTDAFGRRNTMLFAQVTSLLSSLAMVARPTVGMVAFRDLVQRPATQNTWMIACQAALGDLYKDDPQRYGYFAALFKMMGPCTAMFVPLAASALGRRDLRLPYATGSLLTGALLAALAGTLPETCMRADRVAFRLRGTNPFSFVTLFTRGARLRSLALLEALGALVDGRGLFQASLLHKQELFGWGMAERARFMTTWSATYVPGFLLVAPLVRLLGCKAAACLGSVVGVLQQVTVSWGWTRMLTLAQQFGWKSLS